VGAPLLVDSVLEGRDILELVDHEVVDVREQRALVDPFEHVGEADHVVFTLVAAPPADRLRNAHAVVVGGPRRRVLVPFLCVVVDVRREPHLLVVPLERDIVPVAHLTVRPLEPL
jgi:hypothetical protein